MIFFSNLVLQCLALVSCLSWSRHLCINSCFAMLCLLGSDGLWDYVQIVWSNVFGLLLYFFLSILACSPLCLLLWQSSRLQLQEGALCLIVGSCLLMSSLSDRNMRLGNVLLPLGVKQRCLWLRVIRISYITHRVLKQLSVALSLQFGWGSQLNTSEMFWIDISRRMISE